MLGCIDLFKMKKNDIGYDAWYDHISYPDRPLMAEIEYLNINITINDSVLSYQVDPIIRTISVSSGDKVRNKDTYIRKEIPEFTQENILSETKRMFKILDIEIDFGILEYVIELGFDRFKNI